MNNLNACESFIHRLFQKGTGLIKMNRFSNIIGQEYTNRTGVAAFIGLGSIMLICSKSLYNGNMYSASTNKRNCKRLHGPMCILFKALMRHGSHRNRAILLIEFGNGLNEHSFFFIQMNTTLCAI